MDARQIAILSARILRHIIQTGASSAWQLSLLFTLAEEDVSLADVTTAVTDLEHSGFIERTTDAKPDDGPVTVRYQASERAMAVRLCGQKDEALATLIQQVAPTA